MPMRFTLWNTGGDPDEYFSIARAAEAAGWDSLCLNEGTFQPELQEDDVYPYTADGRRSWAVDTPYLEPMTILPAVATHALRLRYLTFVLKLPLREPLTFAKQVATAATMMHDRLDLGVGMSWMPQEYRYCGLDWNTRRRRFLESIEVLRLVLSGRMVEYHGEIFDFGPLMARPAPRRPVPICIGGHADWSLAAAARVGDGWCGVPLSMNDLARVLARLRRQLDDAGRASGTFNIHTGALDAQSVEDYARLSAMGVTDCIVMPWMRALQDAGNDALGVPLSQRLELVQQFAEDVIRPLRGTSAAE